MPKIVNLDLNKIKELWETTSLSQGDIAKEVNTSIDTVRRRIKSNGWVRPDNLIEEEKANRVNKIMGTKIEKGLTDAHADNEEEIFKDLYYNTNLSKTQIAEKMGVRLSRVKHLIEKMDTKRTEEHIKKVKQEVNKELFKDGYNFEKKEIQEKVKQTKLEQYGNRNPFVTSRFKEQAMNTKEEKYGNAYYNNREQSIKTCIEKYGLQNTMQVDFVKDKAKATRMAHIDEVSLNISNAKLKMFSNPENKRKMLDRVAKTCLEKYGVSSYILSDDVRVQTQKISKTNRLFAEKSGITEFEFSLNEYSYDLKKNNILIEIDPTVSHNTEISYVHLTRMCKKENCTEHRPVEPDYHINKSNTALDNGYHCIHIFDWDRWDKIIYMIQDKETLYARNLTIKEVSKDECNSFLNEFHLQNTCQGQTIKIGLYKDIQLIQIMTFGKPRYNKNCEYELLRLCTHKNYKVVGGAERLFKHFLNTYNPSSIVSYCDLSKFTGKVYTDLGFKLNSKPRPSKHWSKGKMHITDNFLRQRGYDQIFNTNYGKGTDNELLMIQNGWLPVYDCGQATYIWNKEV